jgi:hypothetical protein
VFGIGDLVTAVVIVLGVFVGLPSRWAPVDVPAALVAGLDLASAYGLLFRASWGERVARWSSEVGLVLGILLIGILAVTATWLGGVYGPVGMGGAVVMVLVVALALPYVVVLPMVRLFWLGSVKPGRLLKNWLSVFLGLGISIASLCVTVRLSFGTERFAGFTFVTAWSGGQPVARTSVAGVDNLTIRAALQDHPDATVVVEESTALALVLTWPEPLFAMSFVAGQDGISANVGARFESLTPDELVWRQAYDHGVDIPSLGFKAGLDVELALAILADRFGMTVPDLKKKARFTRFRVRRWVKEAPYGRPITAESMTTDDVRGAAIDAARFLVRGVDEAGRFRYLVDGPTNRTLPGYDWPRHAGATYFLAQAAALAPGGEIGAAALRAAGYLRDHAMVACGDHRCVGDGRIVDVGSAALTVIAFVEVARTGLDPSYAAVVPELTEFLRSQQRPDGEFMHEYDRGEGRGHPIDIQLLYYTGEAALALSRAATLGGDPRDLDAARRALSHLAGSGWSFFGSRYYFGEEHWTCQAMEDLWDRAPNPEALDFCVRWQDYDRRLQYQPGETLYDAAGAYGFGPIVTPRLTPVASRCEAGIATLDAADRAKPGWGAISPAERAELVREMRLSLALLLRSQFRPGSSPVPTEPRLRTLYDRSYLLASPVAVYGAMPASEVDWQLRIDFAQHAGSALIRWLSRERG